MAHHPARRWLVPLCGLASLLACGGSPARPPAGLAYPTRSALYTVGVAIPANLPAVTNAVTSWRADPELPAGLALDPSSGAITGTPTVAQGGVDYTVTASNRDGAATGSLNITVRPAGHLSSKLIHFHDDAGWGVVNLVASLDGTAWMTPPGLPMAGDGGGWFSARLPASAFSQFSFTDGASSLPSQPGSALRSSWEEVWVQGGLLFTADPGLATAPAGQLSVLTLNLHTYQERAVSDGGTQAEKLDRVADAIAASGADFVTLQECAQSAGAAVVTDPRAVLVGGGAEPIKDDNMASLISGRLQEVHGLTYRYAWSWAHYGFTTWEEGVAVLTRHPVGATDATYISTSTSKGDPLGARKAIFLGATLPGGQVVNLFSAHLGFSGPEQDRQLDALRSWMAAKAANGAVASLVGGDFNMPQDSPGYLRMTSTTGGDRAVDAAWEANPDGYADPTILDGARIDYLFFRAGDPLQPLTAQRYFLPGDAWLGGRVSDHNATLVRLRLVP